MEVDNVNTVRFWSKVDKSGDCWEWTGALSKGYGAFSVKNRVKQAHRFAYQLVKGEIPEGLELDHLCENKSCVNPQHLEAVEHGENLRRSRTRWNNKTHCKNGHEYTEENVGINNKGSRWCRVCHRESDRAYRRRRTYATI